MVFLPEPSRTMPPMPPLFFRDAVIRTHFGRDPVIRTHFGPDAVIRIYFGRDPVIRTHFGHDVRTHFVLHTTCYLRSFVFVGEM